MRSTGCSDTPEIGCTVVVVWVVVCILAAVLDEGQFIIKTSNSWCGLEESEGSRVASHPTHPPGSALERCLLCAYEQDKLNNLVFDQCFI